MSTKKRISGSKSSGSDDKTGAVSPEEALDEAVKALRGLTGISSWEVYLEADRSLSIEVRDQKVESMSAASSMGMGIRIISESRLAFSFTNALDSGSIKRSVKQAVDAAVHMPDDSFPAFAKPPEGGSYPALDLVDRGLEKVPGEEKVRRAMEMEEAARSYDSRIKTVRSSEYGEVLARVWIRNSSGADASGDATLISGSIEAVADDGKDAQAASEFETVHHYDRLDFARLGGQAAKKAAGLLGGEAVATGRYPVVFSPGASAGLISVLAPAVFGDAVAKKRSWLADKMGEKIAGTAVTIVDDGLWPDGPGSFPFDDEANASRRITVVNGGVLESYLYNMYYGFRADTGSTGNGLRPSYYLPPSVDTNNWVLLPGEASKEDLIKQVGDGLYIFELLGLHTADPVTGEFSVGAAGFRIESGRLGEPVTGIAIAGGMGELLSRVEAVSDEVKFSDDAGSPAILVGSLDVSGNDQGRG